MRQRANGKKEDMMAKVSEKTISNLLMEYKKYVLNKGNWINYCKINWYGKKSQKQITEAITRFCDKESEFFKNNDHTRRVYRTAMENLKKKLLPCIPVIKKMKTFDDIYQFIAKLNVKGIGNGLTAYDISLLLSSCIGLDLDKEPQYVYPHAGTAVGINNLCGLPKSRRKPYKINELDVGLNNVFTKSKLSPAHLEHFFCIIKI